MRAGDGDPPVDAHAPFADAFRPGARFEHARHGALTMAVHALGHLTIRSGRLAACDPFVADWAARDDGFVRRVPTGRFPVDLAIVRDGRGDERVAAARVRLAERAAVRWELARCDQGSAARSPIASLDGYGVDSGTGCFYDPIASTTDDAATDAWLTTMHAGREPGWSACLATVGERHVAPGDRGARSRRRAVHQRRRRRLVPQLLGRRRGRLHTVELVTDFDLLTEDVEERVPLPTARGPVAHPLLAEHGLVVRRGWWRRATITRADADGPARARIARSDGGPVRCTGTARELRFRWPRLPAGVTLEIAIVVGARPLAAMG
jgi:hypothetical protein